MRGADSVPRKHKPKKKKNKNKVIITEPENGNVYKPLKQKKEEGPADSV